MPKSIRLTGSKMAILKPIFATFSALVFCTSAYASCPAKSLDAQKMREASGEFLAFQTIMFADTIIPADRMTLNAVQSAYARVFAEYEQILLLVDLHREMIHGDDAEIIDRRLGYQFRLFFTITDGLRKYADAQAKYLSDPNLQTQLAALSRQTEISIDLLAQCR